MTVVSLNGSKKMVNSCKGEYGLLYNVRVKTFPDGHKQYIWADHFIFRLDLEDDSPVLIEDVKRRYDRISLKRKISKFCLYEGELPEEDVSVRFKRNLSRAINVVYDLARSNEFDWFITLTLNPEYVDRYDYESCSSIIKKFTDRLRKYGCKWLIVPEQHEDGAFHFHGLVSGDLPLTPSGKTWYNEVEGYTQPVYNLATYEFGWTTATEIVHPDRCATYVTEYLTKKPCVPKGKKCYWASKSLVRPEIDYVTTFRDVMYADEQTGEVRVVRDHDTDWGFGFPTGVRYIKEIETEYGRFIISEE